MQFFPETDKAVTMKKKQANALKSEHDITNENVRILKHCTFFKLIQKPFIVHSPGHVR